MHHCRANQTSAPVLAQGGHLRIQPGASLCQCAQRDLLADVRAVDGHCVLRRAPQTLQIPNPRTPILGTKNFTGHVMFRACLHVQSLLQLRTCHSEGVEGDADLDLHQLQAQVVRAVLVRIRDVPAPPAHQPPRLRSQFSSMRKQTSRCTEKPLASARTASGTDCATLSTYHRSKPPMHLFHAWRSWKESNALLSLQQLAP